MQLNYAVRMARQSGRLGLVIYTIPGFPDPKTYRQMMEHLQSRDRVTVIETTIPVTHGHSGHANQTIVDAHRLGVASREPFYGAALEQPRKPSLVVLYRETVELMGPRAAIAQLAGRAEGVLLEWDEPNPEPFVAICQDHGVELVACVGPWMSTEQVKRNLAPTRDKPLVYLMSASMTGARLFPSTEIESCIASIRSCRPDAQVAAGFGVATSGDVARLRDTRGLDAVIVGTAFLRALGAGFEAGRCFLDGIESAL